MGKRTKNTCGEAQTHSKSCCIKQSLGVRKPPLKRTAGAKKSSAATTSKQTSVTIQPKPKRTTRGTTNIPKSGPKPPITKPQSSKTTKSAPSTKDELTSAHLTNFLRVYGKYLEHDARLFSAVRDHAGVSSVLYPGCDKHMIPSLIFPEVTYVDFNAKMTPFYSDPACLRWLQRNRRSLRATGRPTFICKNFSKDLGIKRNSMDLLISQCAGAVSKECLGYVKKKGYFLAGDGHGDAKLAFVNPQLRLVGAYDSIQHNLITDDKQLAGFFVDAKTGNYITELDAERAQSGARTKWGFYLKREVMWYLFQKKD